MNTSLSPSRFWERIINVRHHMRTWWLGITRNRQYQEYLRTQLERTLSKKEQLPELRAKVLIERVIELENLPQDASILCIGSRNTFEIDYFKSKGLSKVVGIDLFSESPDILVMDMHQMDFPDNHFDVIYSSHSLEHTYDIQKVVEEIVRVARPGALIAIEVPVHYETGGADLIDFRDLQTLHAIFDRHLERVLWSEEQPPHSPRNESGTSIIRTVFSIRKNHQKET